jgi:RHS repeat-associated protein
VRYDFTQLVAIDSPGDAIDVTYTWGGADLRGTGGFRAGRLVRVDDGSGREERRYDAIGQMVQEVRTVESPRGGAGSEPQVFTTGFLYDTWGRLQQMRYPDGEALTYAYDSGGRVRSATGIKLGETFEYVTRMEYDRFEQRVFMESGNGIRTHYTYEPQLRRLATLDAGDFQRLTYAYDAVGNITGLENNLTGARSDRYGGRVEQGFRYDDLDRLIGANGEWTSTRGRLETYDVTQSYSDIHTLVSKAQEHTARNGARGRPVIQHETTYSQSYRYDGPRPHAPTQIGERQRTYDANGNLTFVRQPMSGLRRTLRWDAENRVESISDNGRTTDFVYDDRGQRVLKIGAQGETLYANQFWTVRNGRIGTKHIFVGTTRVASKLSPGGAHLRPDPADDLSVMLGRWWEHRSASGFVHARDVEMNPHYRVPSTLPETGTPETNFVYFFHPDHLGSTQYVTDADGELYEHVQYFPSGEPWIRQDSNTERLPYLFTSQELDQETQLYYLGARYYDPRDGSFVSPDPAYPNYLRGSPNGGVFQPVNLQTYCYGWNNPLSVSDPSGACPWCAAVLGGAGVGFVVGVAFEGARQLGSRCRRRRYRSPRRGHGRHGSHRRGRDGRRWYRPCQRSDCGGRGQSRGVRPGRLGPHLHHGSDHSGDSSSGAQDATGTIGDSRGGRFRSLRGGSQPGCPVWHHPAASPTS